MCNKWIFKYLIYSQITRIHSSLPPTYEEASPPPSYGDSTKTVINSVMIIATKFTFICQK